MSTFHFKRNDFSKKKKAWHADNFFPTTKEKLICKLKEHLDDEMIALTTESYMQLRRSKWLVFLNKIVKKVNEKFFALH